MSNLYQIKVKDSKGDDVSLSKYKNNTLLVVNTASKCGFTSQYSGLQDLYEEFKDNNFVVLAFPCNQFGGQEPGSIDEINNFCSSRFNVSFPIFNKVDVNGENASELFEFLKSKAPGLLGSQLIKWNFTKFLINKKGEVIKRYAPKDSPLSIKEDIQKIL